MSFGESTDSGNPFQSPQTVEESYSGGVVPSEKTVEMLRQTRPWVKFLGILAAIAIGFMVLGCVGMLFAGLAGAGAPGGAPPFILMAIMYVIIIAMYWFPMMYLLRYAKRIQEFVTLGGTERMDAALEAQKSFWKFVGMAAAITMVLYVVFIIGIFVFGIGAAAMQPR